EIKSIKGELGHTIKGNGSVLSAALGLQRTGGTQNVGADLLTVANVVKVEAFNDDAQCIYVKLDNLTSSTLQLVAVNSGGQVLAPAGQPGAQSKTILLDQK